MSLLQLPAPLVLASTSKYRQALLRRLGLAFTALAPDYDEAPVPGLDPLALIEHHAREKARAVRQLRPDAWVLAADQGAVLGDRLLGKPGTIDAAVAQLLALAGRTHQLATAVVLALPDGRVLERTVTVEMLVRPLTLAEANAYVAQDQPLDCAGSYRIESAGPWLFEACRGDDPTAIEGLPLVHVAAMLRAAGA